MRPDRRQARQKSLWLSYDQRPQSQGQVLYQRLQQLLHEEGFEPFPEKLCAPFSVEKSGRSSIPPGRSFRMLMIGCFGASTLGPASAGAVRDALSLQEFLGLAPGETVPAHSSLCCTGGACRWRYTTSCLSLCWAFWKKPVCCMAKIRDRRLCHGGECGHEAPLCAAGIGARFIRKCLSPGGGKRQQDADPGGIVRL